MPSRACTDLSDVKAIEATTSDTPSPKEESSQRYECSKCRKTFMTPSKLERHTVTHSGKKPFECKQCGKAFKRPDHLQLHKKIHTSEKTFKCSHCEKLFLTSSHLKRHAMTHTNERRFRCPQCEEPCMRDVNLSLRQSYFAFGCSPQLLTNATTKTCARTLFESDERCRCSLQSVLHCRVDDLQSLKPSE